MLEYYRMKYVIIFPVYNYVYEEISSLIYFLYKKVDI